MAYTADILLAADLADRWIDAILSEDPALLLNADTDDPLTPEEMARNLTQFRAVLIDELAQQPIAFALDDDDDEYREEEDDDDDELEPGGDAAKPATEQPRG